jgi:protein-S-isoprenylcysteine O-methyltransferase Ste14
MKPRMLEAATYVIVGSAILVGAPAAGIYLDSVIFHVPHFVTRAPFLFGAGLALTVGGTALVLWTIVLFKTRGQGTPNPLLPPNGLVIEGPYSYTRNPMALGAFVVLVGEAALYGSPTLFFIAVIFLVIVYVNIVQVEEPELRRRFGGDYEAYLNSVPRFMRVPGVRRR